MMLRSLVKKFKSHSLNEEEAPHVLVLEPSNLCEEGLGASGPTRVSSIATRLRSSLAPHCPHGRPPRTPHGPPKDDLDCKDSGTESDDEELERIETNSTHSVPVSQTSDYYASQQSLSVNSCRSSHCSSPQLGLSDQECNSWESAGSESRCRCSGPVREPQHHYHTRLSQQISMRNGLPRGDGAFVPVGRGGARSPEGRREKRKWGGEGVQARRTPVRLLFPPDPRQLPQQGNVSPPAGSVAKKLRSASRKADGADTCPREGEEDLATRPSLDFNKMRGKLVDIGATDVGNKKQKRNGGLMNCSGMKAKLKTFGRREGYQLRSTHRQCCLFRPLEPPIVGPEGESGWATGSPEDRPSPGPSGAQGETEPCLD